MKDWQVWETVPTAACWQATGRAPLQGKWVDINMGDVANPVVRSRYVAKELANQRDDEFFAATPPLEALRLLLSHAASGRQTGKWGRKVLVLDARKAHLHAMSERTIYVALPPELRRLRSTSAAGGSPSTLTPLLANLAAVNSPPAPQTSPAS